MANQITITGALGRAPALNFTSSGQAAWGFSLAYTPSRKTDNGWEDSGPTLWFDVTAWGADAEDLAQRYSGVEKGRATVTGRLGSRTWTNKDGIEQTQMTITADAITIHPPKQQGGQQGGWGGNQGSYGQPQAGSWNSGQQAQQARPQAQQQPAGPNPWDEQPQGQQAMPMGGQQQAYSDPPF